MITKDKSIIDILEKAKLVLNSISVVDYWDGDQCAIGLKNMNKMVYISTYNYLNQVPIKYDCDFELLDESVSDKLTVLESRRDISEEELIRAMEDFFRN